ncbi:MAG: radical SAM protein [Patescibacteria group bacterium]|jgi:radical SAM superfamily enzyme YgiQ (UPF0313 family)
MKIFLTNPIGYSDYKIVLPPSGILAVASTLVEKGYQVMLYDSYLKRCTAAEFQKVLLDYNPDIIGIGFNVEDRFAAFETAKLAKSTMPAAKIIGGGPFPNLLHREILQEHPYFDVIVRGEGDLTILELVKALAGQISLADVKGITYRYGGEVMVNEAREMVSDLNQLPFPAFQLLDLDEYKSFIPDDSHMKGNKGIFWKEGSGQMNMAGLIFSRGCPFNCIFCSTDALWGRKVRSLSAENAFLQVKYFYDRGFRHFAFQDDHLVTNKLWFFRFCDLLETLPEPIRYFFNSRIDSINKEVIDRAYKTGARIIGLGIENLSDNSLKLMNKRITSQQIWDSLSLLDEYNIQVRGGILINTPGEALSDIGLNIKQHRRLRKYLFQSGVVNPLRIYPGSPLEAEALKRGQMNNFSWVKEYYNESNYILSAPPHIPLFVNLPFYKILLNLIEFSIQYNDTWLVRTLIRQHFVRLADSKSRHFLAKQQERGVVLLGVIFGLFKGGITSFWQRLICLYKAIG